MVGKIVAAATCLSMLMSSETHADVDNLDEAQAFLNGAGNNVITDKIGIEHAPFDADASTKEEAARSLRDYRGIMEYEGFFVTTDRDIATICQYYEITKTDGEAEADNWLAHLQRLGNENKLVEAMRANKDQTLEDLRAFVKENPDFKYLSSSCSPDGGICAACITTVARKEYGEKLLKLLARL
jgi:hypothetical protein